MIVDVLFFCFFALLGALSSVMIGWSAPHDHNLPMMRLLVGAAFGAFVFFIDVPFYLFPVLSLVSSIFECDPPHP
jgi:hypothetical protein